MLASTAILESGDDELSKELLPPLATGEARAAVAWIEDSGVWDEAGITLAASHGSSGWSLTGEKSFVIDGHTADHLVVAGRTSRGVSLFVVESAAEGLVRKALPTMDTTRKQARLEFAATPGRLLGAEGKGWQVLARTLDLAAIQLAAEQVGGAGGCWTWRSNTRRSAPSSAVRSARSRPSNTPVPRCCWPWKRRGRPPTIRCSRRPRMIPNCRYWPAWQRRTAPKPSARWPADNIQVHGGIGFTWEHPAHLYFKRATSSQAYLGDPVHHRARLAEKLGI